MTPAALAAALDRFLPRIARALGVPVERLPLRLDRDQVARVAELGSGKSLAASASRGFQRGDPRWVAFRATIGRGTHSVPVERVAAWLAMDAGLLPLPAPAPASEDAAEHGTHAPAMPAPSPSLEQAWASASGASSQVRLVHRCLGGG